MKENILALECHKHVKIFKLHQLGIPKKEICTLVGSNSGHVRNVLKEYSEKPEKAEAANKIEIPSDETTGA